MTSSTSGSSRLRISAWLEVVDSDMTFGARVSPCGGEVEVMVDAVVVDTSCSLVTVVVEAVPLSGVVLVPASGAPFSTGAGVVDDGTDVVGVVAEAVPSGVVVGAVTRLVCLKLLKNSTRA